MWWVFTTTRRVQIWVVCALCCFLSLSALSMNAQTIRPLISEYDGEAKGSFELVNDGVIPLNVVLEAQSFSVNEDGQISYRPLDSNIHLKLSSMSLRIPPQQSYSVFYTAKADQSPAWFVIYANFTRVPNRDQTGLTLQMELPHVVYVLPKKQRLEKADVKINHLEFDRANKKLLLEVENTGANLGRLTEVDIVAGRQRVPGGGGPLFPQSRRRFKLDWNADEAPEKVVLVFQNFKIEQSLSGK